MSVVAERVLDPSSRPERDYADLKRRIVEAGLLEKQLPYYLVKFAVAFGLFAAAILVTLVTSNFAVQMAGAVLLAFALGQGGLLMHDTTHRQTNRPGTFNDFLSLLTGPCMLGISSEWWIDKHNRHHSHPNQLGQDPDIEIGLAFTPEQAREANGFLRFIVKYQAFFFFPLLLLEAFHLKLASVKFLRRNRSPHRLLETLLLSAHNVGLVVFAIWALGPWRALAFLGLSHALTGLYVGAIFAPNHKGMEMLEEDTPLDFFRRQVITARNVRRSWFNDMWYGGLNYQIEHHLFPNMPRNRLGEAQRIVRAFCRERGVPYHETGMLRSYKEVLQGLHASSAPLREPHLSAS